MYYFIFSYLKLIEFLEFLVLHLLSCLDFLPITLLSITTDSSYLSSLSLTPIRGMFVLLGICYLSHNLYSSTFSNVLSFYILILNLPPYLCFSPLKISSALSNVLLSHSLHSLFCYAVQFLNIFIN